MSIKKPKAQKPVAKPVAPPKKAKKPTVTLLQADIEALKNNIGHLTTQREAIQEAYQLLQKDYDELNTSYNENLDAIIEAHSLSRDWENKYNAAYTTALEQIAAVAEARKELSELKGASVWKLIKNKLVGG